MKALILAAGMGTRLKPVTNYKPKCMVEVNGTPIIFKQIDNLRKNDINDITVVAGYKSAMLKAALDEYYPFVNMITNNEHESTNNMYSAYLAQHKFIDSSFLLMNGDVFFDDIIITELLSDRYIDSIVVEKGVYIEESMKVKLNGDRISRISKQIPRSEAYGVSIDVYKFSSEGSRAFFQKMAEYIEIKKDLKQWTEVALNDILSEVQFKPCLLKGRWMEIDNHDDLKKAEDIFA